MSLALNKKMISNSTKQAQSIVGTSPGRPKTDFYKTPPGATLALLEAEKLFINQGDIWEPACGDGAISEILVSRGYSVISSDKYDHGYGTTGIDFLSTVNYKTPTIITNPPYNIINKWIQHAYDIGVSYMALLCKLALLEGYERSYILERTGLKRYYVFRRRIQMGREGTNYGNSGMIAFAWFVWDKKSKNVYPETHWIDAKDAEIAESQMKLF